MSYYGTNSNANAYGGGPPQQPPYNTTSQQQQQPTYNAHTSWQQQQAPNNNYNNTQSSSSMLFGQQAPTAVQNQQQQQQQPSLWNNTGMAGKLAAAALSSTTTSTANNDAMLDMAETMGKHFLQDSTARMIPGLEKSMNALRHYFAVDHAYVIQKLKRVLLPLLYKHWSRTQKQVAPPPNNNGSIVAPPQYQLPLHDPTAPDLYLPLLCGITYVLLSAFLSGSSGGLKTAEVIGKVATTCSVVQGLEVFCFWLGCYWMGANTTVEVLDLVAYTGYKYVGLSLSMAVAIVMSNFGLQLGKNAYYGMFLWTASAMSYFMLKTMANNIPLNVSRSGPKREFMVLGFAATQFLTMWMVSQTKYL